jgi:predicted TIM-barrel fold metal-dependent hydrolase
MRGTAPTVDAYSHVGLPRFCSPDQALDVCEQWGIGKAVFSLGPGVPDILPLAEAVLAHPNRARAVGIPFGETETQRYELVGLQLDAGFLGIRMDHGEVLANSRALYHIGQRAAWIYYVGMPLTNDRADPLVQWLDTHPDGRIAAPHFLRRDVPNLRNADLSRVRGLLEHPRFFPILSRQGDGRSQGPYPYADLRPWVEMLVRCCGWERMLWGSEHPVLLWRNETIAQCREWFQDAGISMSSAESEAFFGGNAQRLFFDKPPACAPVEIPRWLEEQFDRTRPVNLFQNTTLDIPMDRFAPLMKRYLVESAGGSQFTFSEFVARRLM